MENDTFNGDFMVKLVWRLSGVSIGENTVKNYKTISTLILP